MITTSAEAVESPTAAASAQSPIRVAMILPTYLPESFGGAEQQARKLALSLARQGVSVELLAPRLFSRTLSKESDGPLRVTRFRVRHAPNLGGRHMVSFLAWCIKLTWWLARHSREYDVVHIIHGRLHAVPAVLAARAVGKPSVVKIGRGGAEHFDLNILSRKRLLGKWYARSLVGCATAYVANSYEIAEDLSRWHIADSRIHRIANGVEIPERPAAHPGPPLRCVYHGRLGPEKAIDIMIRGFAQLPEAAATLCIVGDGECREQLENLVDVLGLRDRVTFTGSLPSVASALHASHVYVSTSLSEGMSNALLEAMSFGLVPVVSNVSGVADIVEDGQSGLVFKADDLPAFTQRLRDVVDLSETARRDMGANARRTVSTRFGIDQVALKHRELYEQLTRGRSGNG